MTYATWQNSTARIGRDGKDTYRAFTYDVRCFGGIFELPTLIRYFNTKAYLVKSDSA